MGGSRVCSPRRTTVELSKGQLNRFSGEYGPTRRNYLTQFIGRDKKKCQSRQPKRRDIVDYSTIRQDSKNARNQSHQTGTNKGIRVSTFASLYKLSSCNSIVLLDITWRNRILCRGCPVSHELSGKGMSWCVCAGKMTNRAKLLAEWWV